MVSRSPSRLWSSNKIRTMQAEIDEMTLKLETFGRARAELERRFRVADEEVKKRVCAAQGYASPEDVNDSDIRQFYEDIAKDVMHRDAKTAPWWAYVFGYHYGVRECLAGTAAIGTWHFLTTLS